MIKELKDIVRYDVFWFWERQKQLKEMIKVRFIYLTLKHSAALHTR